RSTFHLHFENNASHTVKLVPANDFLRDQLEIMGRAGVGDLVVDASRNQRNASGQTLTKSCSTRCGVWAEKEHAAAGLEEVKTYP
ncbi:unnamed protein product, partial [Amoebophrya sp. A120]